MVTRINPQSLVQLRGGERRIIEQEGCNKATYPRVCRGVRDETLENVNRLTRSTACCGRDVLVHQENNGERCRVPK